MSHLLFAEKPSVHGPLHGGWRGISLTDPLHRPAAEFTLANAVDVGLMVPPTALPPSVDFSTMPSWSQKMETDNQAAEGSCVSFGAKHIRQFISLQAGHALQEHSPRAFYRAMQIKYEPSLLGQDTGAYISWAAGVMVDGGIALEADWPYSDNPADLIPAPPWIVNYRATYYKNVVAVTVPSDAMAMKRVLAAGHAFILGFLVYDSFYQAQGTGRVPMPKLDGSDPLLGGHCVFCIGYKDDPAWAGGGYFTWLNQWGSFTPRNFLYVPYAMIAAQDPTAGPVVSDCWSIVLAPTA